MGEESGKVLTKKNPQNTEYNEVAPPSGTANKDGDSRVKEESSNLGQSGPSSSGRSQTEKTEENKKSSGNEEGQDEESGKVLTKKNPQNTEYNEVAPPSGTA